MVCLTFVSPFMAAKTQAAAAYADGLVAAAVVAAMRCHSLLFAHLQHLVELSKYAC